MNIIYARMSGYNWISTPSDAVARELQHLGHKVTIVEDPNYLPLDKYDFVWSPYESVTLLGDYISKKLDIPHCAHIEWFPPWRILDNCDVTQYGYIGNEPELQKKQEYQKHFRQVAQAYNSAIVRTIASKHFVNYLKDWVHPTGFRYPSIDHRTIQTVSKQYSPKKQLNKIITISRAVPNKRYDLLIQVMNRIQSPAEWHIIGGGPQVQLIKETLNNDNITLVCHESLWGWAKYYELMSSNILLGGWTGMPPIEALLLNVWPILINQTPNSEVDGDIFQEYFNGQLETYSISDILTIVPERITKALEEKEDFEDKIPSKQMSFIMNEFGVKTSHENAKELINSMRPVC